VYIFSLQKRTSNFPPIVLHAVCSAIGIGIITSSVHLSVTLRVVAKRYILQQTSLNKWIGSVPPRNTILQPYLTLSLKLRCSWCYLTNRLKRSSLNKRTARISTSGIAIVSMLHGYSSQCAVRSAPSQQQLGYL